MKCGGHVGRAHEKALKQFKSKKEFDSGYVLRHKESFPEVESVVCTCKGRKHSRSCGYLSDVFVYSVSLEEFLLRYITV